MRYWERQPCAELSSLINCFWYFETDSNADLMDNSFPDGCVEIVFNIGARVFRSEDGKKFNGNPRTEIIGQFSSRYVVRCEGEKRFLGVRFFPHTFSQFSPMPLNEFSGLTLDAENVLDRNFCEIAAAVHDGIDPVKMTPLLEQYFLRRLRYAKPDRKTDLLHYIVPRLVAESSTTPLDFLMRRERLNARFLQRLFLDRVGMSAKHLVKVIRFQRTFQYLNARDLKLSDIAYACGYFDQAHFIRDFKAFSGTTPSQYRETIYPINQNFLSAHSNAYLFGIR